MDKTNKYYDSIKDDDLNTTKSYKEMILVCKNCGAMFGMKACGNRTLFPWFGYHPTDGNCQVLTDEGRSLVSRKAYRCQVEKLERVRTKKELDQAIIKL